MLHPPAVCPGARSRKFAGGFSLVELLVVSAIIGTLVFIGFAIIQGARQQADRSHARSDLAALSQALEQYRRSYGDYPQTADSPERFYQALVGKLGPTGISLHERNLLAAVPVALRDPANPAAEGNALVDPWGNAYQYVFFTRQVGTAPLLRGYVLYSLGSRHSTAPLPTRAQVVPDTSGARGGTVSSAPINTPNIYAGR
ncbi:MAG: Type II secretory pathway [Verrucomicrobia bacterium]|jgi:general secretion pathway protein G|nr:MAG: Type II secretory pathway [Verrucomicrobiota bacterium]